jgi:hypothetical protein
MQIEESSQSQTPPDDEPDQKQEAS